MWNEMIPNSQQECLANPFGNVGRGTGYSRYHPFQLLPVSYGMDPKSPKNVVTYKDRYTWVPFHKSYEAIWSAVRYGYYAGKERMIFDLFTGEIVWQNYNKECKRTYFYKGYGK